MRRGAVNEAAGCLQRDGLLTYRRGRISVMDLAGLRAASCLCCDVIRKLETAPAR